MFRTDRDALAQEVEDLRRERSELREQNDALRTDLLNRRQQAPAPAGAINVYKQGVAHLTPGERVALSRHAVKSFPVWAAVVLHFLTGGLFSLVHFSRLHDQLPRAEHDDPSASRAVGFSFIPYFHFYWMVFNSLRLVDRLNLQFRLRGLPAKVPRGIILSAAISGTVPQIYVMLGFPLFWPLAIFFLQRAANELAALERAREVGDAEASTAEARPRVRVPLVKDLPGPDQVIGHHRVEVGADDLEDAGDAPDPRAAARQRAS